LYVDVAAQVSGTVPCVKGNYSLSDKLRFAASRGQLDYMRHLLTAGVASSDPDAVSCI